MKNILVSIAIALVALSSACASTTGYELRTPETGVQKIIDPDEINGRFACGNERMFIVVDRWKEDRIEAITSAGSKFSPKDPLIIEHDEQCGFTADARVGSTATIETEADRVTLTRISYSQIAVRRGESSTIVSYPLTNEGKHEILALGVSPALADNLR